MKIKTVFANYHTKFKKCYYLFFKKISKNFKSQKNTKEKIKKNLKFINQKIKTLIEHFKIEIFTFSNIFIFSVLLAVISSMKEKTYALKNN